jgi:hypothetical protein
MISMRLGGKIGEFEKKRERGGYEEKWREYEF